MTFRINNNFFFIIFGIMFLLISNISLGTEYWVTKQGNDTNGCTNNSSDACLTIQKGISKLIPGDTLNIEQGTYIENSATTPFHNPCSWFEDVASICVKQSGTLDKPITIRAAPGHKDKVIIDSELKRIGIHIRSQDYIIISGLRIINNRIAGIATWGQPANRIADESRLSIGVIVENNYIYNTDGKFGKNIGGIHMWGSKDWIVRNNFIDYITRDGALTYSHTSGIQAYGTINALVEHNYVTRASTGVLWKDHFVADAEGTPIFESEIRYNVFNASTNGVAITNMGTGSDEAGNNYIHHNIIYGHSVPGIGVATAYAFDVSKGLRIEHNLLDGHAGIQSTGIRNDGYIDHSMSGNIIIRHKRAIATWPKARLVASNYNIFDTGNPEAFLLDGLPDTIKVYKTLDKWKAVISSETLSLSVDNPDSNSIEVADPSTLFNDITKRDYRYTDTSPAKGFMPDGTNAGPYQYGYETIGLLPGAYKQPSQVTKVTIKP